MKRFKNVVFPAVGFVILVGAFVLTSPSTGHGQGGPPTQNVTVVNTTANPVPTAAQGTTNVAGNVSVTNTPTVNLAAGASVGINNTPTVNLGSLASVRVNNTAANAVFVSSVDDRVRQIYQVEMQVNLPVGSFGDNTFVNVPFGKRLIIEHVSVVAVALEKKHLRYELTTQANGVQATHRLVSEEQGLSAFYNASQEMRVYGDPGSLVIFSVNRPMGISTASADMTVSGYFVNIP